MKLIDFNPFATDDKHQFIMDEFIETSDEQKEKIFAQHSQRIPDEGARETLRVIRQATYKLSLLLETCLPPSRERSLAQTNLDQVRMWACNAATLSGTIK